jgi:hypothetical protein
VWSPEGMNEACEGLNEQMIDKKRRFRQGHDASGKEGMGVEERGGKRNVLWVSRRIACSVVH